MICFLEELYINNNDFTILSRNENYNLKAFPGRTTKAMKLFLEQKAYLEFREDFDLYFENQLMYFIVWNIVFKSSWENQEIADRANQFSKHILRTFNVCMYKSKQFNHKINLFTFEEFET
jgi:hypothetical protein